MTLAVHRKQLTTNLVLASIVNDEDEDTPSFASPAQTAVKGKTEEVFLKTFPDTAVLVKSAATPFLTKNKEEVLI